MTALKSGTSSDTLDNGDDEGGDDKNDDDDDDEEEDEDEDDNDHHGWKKHGAWHGMARVAKIQIVRRQRRQTEKLIHWRIFLST